MKKQLILGMTILFSVWVYADSSTGNPSADHWIPLSVSDPMTGKNSTQWLILSTINTELPKEPQQHILSVGRNPSSHDVQVMVAILGKHQLSCRNTCDLRVRFDDGTVESWTANLAPNFSNFIFIIPAERFVSKLRMSKKVLIEIPFTNFGAFAFSFKAEGLPSID